MKMSQGAKLLFLAGALGVAGATAAELHIGAATISITPERPVALDGQFKTRISKGIDSSLTATAVAIEGLTDGQKTDQAIFVSVDMIWIQPALLKSLRGRLASRIPDFDGSKLILTATHTHTAPVVQEGWYQIPSEGVMRPNEYKEFLLGRLEDLIVRAWSQRKPGGVSWGLGQAVVGHNRRSVYADGSAKMYGETDEDSFRGFEGGADPGLETLFFWDDKQELLATGVNVACPSQVLEHHSTISADFWHDVREQLHAGLAKDLCVLGWPGASGDISPHWLYRKAAENRMLKLRGLTYTQEIGRRIAREVIDLYALVRNDIRTNVPFTHKVETLTLPTRKITESEAANAEREIAELKQKNSKSLKIGWHEATLKRYRNQEKSPTFTVEVHVVRIGDVAVTTNPFELYQDFATQIKARSKADQTFVLELTCGASQYLPTARAVAAGGYGAIAQSNTGGAEAAQILVDRTVEMIHAMWSETER
jgi:hypothetical protein